MVGQESLCGRVPVPAKVISQVLWGRSHFGRASAGEAGLDRLMSTGKCQGRARSSRKMGSVRNGTH